jgi:diacylglycerol kinase family enzyme
MTSDAIVIVNGGSGGGNDQALVEELARIAAAAGLRARIELAHGDDIAGTIAAAIAARPRLIVAGGGDGTISAVAGALVDTGIALGVLPLGTLNHFAKDLGIPLELEAAVRVLAEGRTARIDVGEVNGRIFVNNSSLGLYPEIVRLRERQQKRFGRAKWVAFARAAVATLRRYPFLGVSLTIDGAKALRRTPFVFIGNNE